MGNPDLATTVRLVERYLHGGDYKNAYQVAGATYKEYPRAAEILRVYGIASAYFPGHLDEAYAAIHASQKVAMPNTALIDIWLAIARAYARQYEPSFKKMYEAWQRAEQLHNQYYENPSYTWARILMVRGESLLLLQEPQSAIEWHQTAERQWVALLCIDGEAFAGAHDQYENVWSWFQAWLTTRPDPYDEITERLLARLIRNRPSESKYRGDEALAAHNRLVAYKANKKFR